MMCLGMGIGMDGNGNDLNENGNDLNGNGKGLGKQKAFPHTSSAEVIQVDRLSPFMAQTTCSLLGARVT